MAFGELSSGPSPRRARCRPVTAAAVALLCLATGAVLAGHGPEGGPATGAPSGRQVGCGWASGFWLSDFDMWVSALAEYDDGGGPALYAAGYFEVADGVRVEHVARWDGTTWSPLESPAGVGVDWWGLALTVYDDGTGPALVVGGAFFTAGGVTANRVARWDGSAWSALSGPAGEGTDGGVHALAAFDDGSGPVLVAGGAFTTAGGVTANRVARWDGSGWSAIGGPSEASDTVRALAVLDDGSGPALYVAGSFASVGGVTVNNIARFSGTAWSALTGPQGTGTDAPVSALTVIHTAVGPRLVAGGEFTTAGGVTVNHVAVWDGSAWSALSGPSGTGTDRAVWTLAEVDEGGGPVLVAGGDFTTAGGVATSHVARWSADGWSAMGAAGENGTTDRVAALAVHDDGSGAALYAAGRFAVAGSVEANHVARWRSGAWSSLSPPGGTGVGDAVMALTVSDDGTGPALVVGGPFAGVGGIRARRVARWDGGGWSAFAGPSGSGPEPWVESLCAVGGGPSATLYAGGVGDPFWPGPHPLVWRWDGSDWSVPPGSPIAQIGSNSAASALTTWDDGSGPALFVAGGFAQAGGATVNNLARWDGTNWSALGDPPGLFGRAAYALAVHDDGAGPGLFVGGEFFTAGGVIANGVARWDGSSWSALGDPPGVGNSAFSRVEALTTSDDGSGPALLLGGAFTSAGGVAASNLARWDGTAFSPLGGPSGEGTDGRVAALAVAEGAGGPLLVAGGRFAAAGGVSAGNIAVWDGTAWSALEGPAGNGTDGEVMALEVLDFGDGAAIYAGGYFSTAGGVPSKNLAVWVCEGVPPTDPVSVTSTSHVPGAWSNRDVVDATWSGAADSGGSGLHGYSLLFDQQPGTVPDSSVEVLHRRDPHRASSDPLPDGDGYHLHLRTCDSAGNCAPGTHLGPFRLDATPPQAPAALASTSHQVGVPSEDPTVDAVWSPAVDNLSGVDGYGLAWTWDLAWTCDRVKDLEEDVTSATSPRLPIGAWYVHVCAVDQAGNWSVAASAGPYLIVDSSLLFGDGFEGGGTGAWSITVP